MQLQDHMQQFEQAGLGIALITYDTPELQQAFVDKFSIRYPVLSDVDAQSVKALGILNEEYAPGQGPYGIPHPGVFIIAPDSTIKGKVFVEAYSERVSAEGVLRAARQALNLG